jgi:uncharacterized integral membrane protein
MKGLFWIVVVPLAAASGFFAVANRGLVTVDLWPVSGHLDMPLYIALLAIFSAGFVIGAFVAWISAGRARSRARAAERRANALEREVAVLQHRFEEAAPAVPSRKAPQPARLAAERVSP